MPLTTGDGQPTEKKEPNSAAAGLADLPQLCIAYILRYTTPRDVGRLACVSSTFHGASQSDLVWEGMLPPDYVDILAQAENSPSKICSKKEIYQFLCRGVSLQNGTRDYWLDRPTGGICQSIGARGLDVIECGDQRYCRDWGRYTRLPIGATSRFYERAGLNLAYRLKIVARFDCFLSPGDYTVTWRVSQRFDKSINPVMFYLEATDNEPIRVNCYFPIQEKRTSREKLKGKRRDLVCRMDTDYWMEIDVGEFMVENQKSPVCITGEMWEIKSGIWWCDRFLDWVMIRPSRLVPNEVWGFGISGNEVRG